VALLFTFKLTIANIHLSIQLNEKGQNMRALTNNENQLVAGGCGTCERDAMREALVDSSLLIAPFVGVELGMAAVAGMGLGYSIGGFVLGAYAAIVAVPLATRVGLEMAYVVHDVLA
ncbi:MAG TPA: hypothetical protein PLD88_00915, partial [Candidatus Berkiella sp.]|nr:hypothetical protein [Candidatus Berkiella sp.]